MIDLFHAQSHDLNAPTGVPFDKTNAQQPFISFMFVLSYKSLMQPLCQQTFPLLAGVHLNLHESPQGF